MKLQNATDPIHFDRARLRSLALGLALGLIPLTTTGMIMAQTPETAEPTGESATENVPISTSELDPETEACPDCGCPGCGRGSGKGTGKGHGKRGQRAGQGHGCQGRGQGGQQGQGRGGRMGGSGRPEAQVIHFLIENHESLERTVEEIPGGVRTRTISQDPEIIDALGTHVRQMVDLIHGGGRIRNWDPLFVEIFNQREAIEMEIIDIDGGVEVTETSSDDQVVKLIRAHAVKVEEFVARGLEAYKEETPLPADYSENRP